MAKLGFKGINKENWLLPNDSMVVFSTLTLTGQSGSLTGEDWLERMLQPKLEDYVPDEVQALFEVARGALIYGYLFHPLYTLGAEQLSRVGEASIARRCGQLRAPPAAKTFDDKIKWLVSNAKIASDDVMLWTVTRQLRNYASHPERQSIIMPRDALIISHEVAGLINRLFDGGTEHQDQTPAGVDH